ncbi:glycine zipper 2TM domain-containing protein [Sphingobium nicotianae]|uniref:17 kDa surface antigen n=1 Tax=Sphingobium nicotianae TaxID=2782607 RepID=A0A9X1IT29_9SPHN|nr:glycine zipper 2TM domain-containing protein [Sphingobium nicotianae]MBT2189148.1 glycine zipper 2TM domain-containing protein [Sphingobium nicotianae]
MRSIIAAALAASMLVGCMDDEGGSRPETQWRRYDYNRPDPSYGGYYADRYYREDSRYRERRLSRNDRIYRGSDDRYYCRRSDGTTGLVVGAIVGGALGNRIGRGGSETLGTLLGALAGAAAGREIDRSGDVRCR